jgi:hypothetical protein
MRPPESFNARIVVCVLKTWAPEMIENRAVNSA